MLATGGSPPLGQSAPLPAPSTAMALDDASLSKTSDALQPPPNSSHGEETEIQNREISGSSSLPSTASPPPGHAHPISSGSGTPLPPSPPPTSLVVPGTTSIPASSAAPAVPERAAPSMLSMDALTSSNAVTSSDSAPQASAWTPEEGDGDDQNTVDEDGGVIR